MAQCQSVILEDQGLGFNLQRRLFGKKGLRDAPEPTRRNTSRLIIFDRLLVHLVDANLKEAQI